MRKSLIAIVAGAVASLALIVPAAAQYGPTPTLTLDNPNLMECHVGMVGTDFAPNSVITLTITPFTGGPGASRPLAAQTPPGSVFTPARPVTDANGSFSAGLDIANTTPVGARFVITATDTEGNTASAVATNVSTERCPRGATTTTAPAGAAPTAPGAAPSAPSAAARGAGRGLAFTGSGALGILTKIGIILAAVGGLLLLVSRQRRFRTVG